MQHSAFNYSYELESRRGRIYTIGVRAEPNINNPESFAVILFFQREDGVRVTVVRVDNSPHDDGVTGDIHVDRFDRSVGSSIKEYDHDIDDVYDAEDFVRRNWKVFADRYYESHKDEPRDDGANV